MATYRSKTQKYNVVLSLIKTARASRNDPVKLKRELFIKFSKLGGVYVKFLQILALNERFMADWGGSTELNVFESVPFDKIDIRKLLRSELGVKAEQIAYLTEDPVAAGSFAQVYRGVLASGEDVIIKVLKPSVVENIKSDLKFITNIARIIDKVYKGTLFKFKDAAVDLRKTAYREIDYKTEVANLEWFGEYLAKNPQILVPKVYKELCSDKVIVEEFIDGISLASAMQMQAEGHDIVEYVKQKTGSDLWEQITVLGSSFLLSMLNSKYVFGDPHPGNIFLLPENKIALIDFGIVVKPPKDTTYMHQLIQEYLNIYEGKFNAGPFAVAFIGLFDAKLMQALQTFARVNFPNSKNKINQILEKAVNSVMFDVGEAKSTTDILSDMRIIRLFADVINKGNRFGIHVNPAATQMHKAMMVFTSMVASIGLKYPDRPHLAATKRGIEYALKFAPGAISSEFDGNGMSAEEATERVMNWLGEIAVKDPILYKQLASMAAK